VYVFAFDDARPEGERVAIAAQSVISKDTRFDHATVRNVEVDVIDNDKADVVVTELDPNTTQPDANTIVLEGTTTTQVTDIYDVQLAKAPVDSTGSVTVTIAPSNNRLCLDSADPRFHAADATCPVLGTTYTLVFGQANWNMPARITVRARNDFVTEDPQSTTLLHTVTTTNDADYNAAKATISARINGLSIDDETPGVFLLESNGRTLVVACGNPPTCTTPGTGDSYTVRLTKAPTAPVTIAVVTDGQIDVTLGGRVALDLVGGARPQQLFTGNIRITGSVLTRGDGADLGSFLDDGFAVGQRIRITGSGAPIDTTVASISPDGKSMTVGSAAGVVPGSSTISQLVDRGIYAGSFTVDSTVSALARTDGKSWLDSGFLEGQLVNIPGIAGTFKITRITDAVAGSGKLDLAQLAPVTGSCTTVTAITQCAPVITFTSTNWYQQVTVPLLADPAFQLPPGRSDLKTFPKRAHLLSGIRGPLAVEGGTTGADRSLHQAVLLPGESNGPLFQIAAQPPEWQQIDTLNVYADGSTQDLVGQMTSTAITGLNMTDDLDFTKSFPAGFKFPFGEPGKYPGGVSYGTITLDANGN
ncbi:MAG TPA: hypothetical protein VGA62_07565, partial [Acidimicrobiia bacterium]